MNKLVETTPLVSLTIDNFFFLICRTIEIAAYFIYNINIVKIGQYKLTKIFTTVEVKNRPGEDYIK